MRKTSRVLFVGASQTFQRISRFFPANDFIVTQANNQEELLSHLASTEFDLALAEAQFDLESPIHLVDSLQKLSPHLPLIVLSASQSVELAIELMKHGADDLLLDQPAVLKDIPNRIKAVLSKNIQAEQEEHSDRIIEIHTISQNSIDPFLAVNKQGRIIEWNQHMTDLTGISEAQAIGQTIWNIQYQMMPKATRQPALLDRLRETTLSMLSKEAIPSVEQGVELDIERTDGSRRVINQTMFPLRQTSEFIVGSILHDITDKKLAEEAFRASEERYRLLVELVPDGIIVHTDGIIVFANPKVLELAGTSSLNDLVGKSIFDFVHPDFTEFVTQRVIKSGYQTPLPPAEEKFIRLDGSIFDAEVQTRPIIFQGKPANLVLIRDITQRKHAEEKLRVSETRLSEAQHLAHLGSFEMTADMRSSYWSDELYNIFDRDPALGQLNFFAFLRHVHPQDRPMINALFKQTIKKGIPFQGEFRIIVGGGEVKYLQATGKPILDETARIVKVFGTIADITRQKLIEQALRASEARYHGLFEHAPIVISEQDFSGIKAYLDNLRINGSSTDIRAYLKAHPQVVKDCLALLKIHDINQAGLNLFRASHKIQILDHLNLILREESLPLFEEELVNIYNGDYQFTVEGINFTIDGEARDVQLRWIVASGSETNLANIIVTITDITERNCIMQELIRSEKKFRGIVEQSLDGIVITNRQGVIIEWNQGMERMSGLDRANVIGKLSWDIQYQQMVDELREKTSPEDEKTKVIEYLSNSDAPWFGKVIEHPIQQPDGTRRMIQSIYFPIQTGQENLIVNISRDVTDYLEARLSLSQAQERIQLITENISDLIILFDPNGILSYASPSFKDTLGYDPEEMVGTNAFSYIHPDDIDMVRNYIFPRILQGEDLERIDYRVRRKDGSFIWLETGAQPIFNATGGVEHLVASSRDVTERKKTEHELQSAQIQLAHRIAELEIRTQELNLLTEMTNMLQICANPAEAISVIAQYANDLFPGVSGVLYTQTPDENLMKGGAFWGNYSGEPEINHKDCWGLRRGRIHTTQDSQSSLYCRHTGFPQPSSSICVPVMSSGMAIGLLSLQTPQNSPTLTTAQQKLTAATAEQIGLALSNLNLRQNLREMAIRDSLTGLYNRHFLEETLETELNRAQRSGKPIGLIMLDLDHFKELNSLYGHPNVDQMLREFGAMLKRSIRSGDIACRYGGDEFLLILPETPISIAEQRAEQIKMQVKALVIQADNLEPRNASASIGVACWPQHGKTSLRLLNIVDAALFKAKQAGGDRVVLAE